MCPFPVTIKVLWDFSGARCNHTRTMRTLRGGAARWCSVCSGRRKRGALQRARFGVGTGYIASMHIPLTSTFTPVGLCQNCFVRYFFFCCIYMGRGEKSENSHLFSANACLYLLSAPLFLEDKNRACLRLCYCFCAVNLPPAAPANWSVCCHLICKNVEVVVKAAI